MDRTRVLSIIPSLNGGTGKDLIQKAVAMDPDAFEVTVFAFLEPGNFSGYADDVDHVRVISPGSGSLPSAVRAGRRLRSSWHPDVVHSHLFKGYLVGTALTVGRSLPLVYSVQNLEDNKSRVKRVAHRSVNTTVDALVAISEAVAEDYTRKANVSEELIEVIPNSADFSKIRSEGEAEPTRPVIGTVARLHPVKRLDVLLEALRSVAENHDVVCWLIGEDQGEEERLRRLAAELGIADRVEFEGWIEDPYERLAAMDVFVLPSRSEGLGMAAIEALALEVPVVASRVGGLRDVVDDGETGWLVDPDDPGAFADRIDWCLSNPAAAAQMGSLGSERVRERFSSDRLATRQEKVYNRVVTND